MAKKGTFEWVGAQKIQDAFLNIPAFVNSGVVDKELVDAGKPLIKRAKEISSNADNTGNLTRSLGALSERRLGKEPAAIVMGPRRGRGHKGHHAHLVEYGTSGTRKASGKVLAGGGRFFGKEVAAMPAFPFLRPAYDETAQQVADNVKRLYSRLIEAGARKGGFQ